MDYIREFDIRLEKEMYYAGETLNGVVVLDTSENFKVKAIRVLLRGKAHTEWKVMVSGDRRTVKDDQYYIDDRVMIWGKEKAEGNVPILPRGMHQFPFRFQLPESNLPCSFESRAGTIRYYLKVSVDIPYASPPQGMKYFTIIGPHIDCMDFLRPTRGETKRRRCCLCCESGKVSLRTDFERSAYVCGESLRVRADIDNQSEEEVRLKLRLVQYVEYYIDRGVLGVQKEGSNTILEYRGAPVSPHSRTKWDSQQNLVLPTIPPTLVGVCRLLQIYYVLKVNVELEKSGEDLHMHFPLTIATVPFRIPNSNQMPVITYEVSCDHAEGGMYIGPEFLLGQVYDGTSEFGESIVLYRPVYPTVKSDRKGGLLNNMNNSIESQPQSSASTPNATKGLKVDVPKDLSIPIPQVHQPKPGTSSAASATAAAATATATATTNNKANKPSNNPATTPTSNSNLISATPSTSTSTTKAVAATMVEGTATSSTIPDGENLGQSANKSLGTVSKDTPAPVPCSSSSHKNSSTAILPTVHKTRVPPAAAATASAGESDEKKSKTDIFSPSASSSGEANNSASLSNTDPSASSGGGGGGSSSSKRLRKLNSATSSGVHVSFDDESSTSAPAPGGESGPSTSKKLKTPSTTSGSVDGAGGKCSKKDSTKIVPELGESGSGNFLGQAQAPAKSAAVDIAVSKIVKDDTIGKSRGNPNPSAVFPGKVVKLESTRVDDGSGTSTTSAAAAAP